MRIYREMSAALVASASLVMGAAGLVGCLPGDTRPVPGSVFVTASPSDATAHGFKTSDGWSVAFDRLLVGMGNIDFHDDNCAGYGEAHYAKLFDFAAPSAASPQKVGLAYGLGACPVTFDVRSPSDDAPLTAGVTSADVAFMNARASDAFVTDDEGAVVYATGHATKGATTKRFAWLIRQRFDVQDCPAGADAGAATNLHLKGNDAVTLDISVHGEELFRASADDGAALRFDDLAAADVNGDGDVTLEELALVPAPVTSADTDGGVVTLADLVYLALTTRMPQVGGGACEIDVHDHDHH